MKSAAVAIVGRPSSGKSTLLNRVCGRKVSIVSAVPQTTRNKVRGILTDGRGQLVFIDTPGFHLSDKKLNRYLRDLALAAVAESDLILYIVDGSRSFGEEEEALIHALAGASNRTVIALNKKDAAGPEWSGRREKVAVFLPGVPLCEVSALSGEGMEELLGRLFALAQDGERLYPEEYYTDQQPEFRIAEIVREKAINLTREEVPHSLYVRLEDLEFRGGGSILWVRGFILVERDSQKGILVGKGGEKIKSIVREAEAELADLFPYAVRLDVRVRVDKNWRKRDALLRTLIR